MKKIGTKINNIEVLKRVNWNRINYIYKRRVATEMHETVKETEGYRLRKMVETKVNKGRGLQLQVRR